MDRGESYEELSLSDKNYCPGIPAGEPPFMCFTWSRFCITIFKISVVEFY